MHTLAHIHVTFIDDLGSDIHTHTHKHHGGNMGPVKMLKGWREEQLEASAHSSVIL